MTPEVLVNPQIQQNSAHPSGSGLYLNLQKIYQISGCQYNRLYTQYVKNACNYGVLHCKGSQFSAICNYLFVLGPGCEAGCRMAFGCGRRAIFGACCRMAFERGRRVIFGLCASRFGAQRNKRPPERGSRLPCVAYRNAYSLRGVTLTYDLPAPFLQNSTVPSTRAKSVWSLPIPTFSPGL